MVFLEVYYTSLDFDGVGAEGYTLTNDHHSPLKTISRKNNGRCNIKLQRPSLFVHLFMIQKITLNTSSYAKTK